MTDAAVHDSQALEAVLHPEPGGRGVWADSAYRSQETEALLKMQNFRSHIQEKGYRDKPLTAQQKECNRRRARTRVRVKHMFGHQVIAMGGKFIRTIGVVRARAKIGLKNLVYNLQRVGFLTATSRQQVAS